MAARKYRRTRFREDRSPKAERQQQPYYIDDPATGYTFGVRRVEVEVGEPIRTELPGRG